MLGNKVAYLNCRGLDLGVNLIEALELTSRLCSIICMNEQLVELLLQMSIIELLRLWWRSREELRQILEVILDFKRARLGFIVHGTSVLISLLFGLLCVIVVCFDKGFDLAQCHHELGVVLSDLVLKPGEDGLDVL